MSHLASQSGTSRSRARGYHDSLNYGRAAPVGPGGYHRLDGYSAPFEPRAQPALPDGDLSRPEYRAGYYNHAHPPKQDYVYQSQEQESGISYGSGTDLGRATGSSVGQTQRPRSRQAEELRPIDPPKGYPTLDWLPIFLRTWANIVCCIAYAGTVAGLVILVYRSDVGNQYQTDNENVFLVVRYGPSVLGTITSLLFRTTSREFFRICRYAVMADTKKSKGAGMTPKRSLLARYYPLPIPSSFNWGVTSCVAVAQLISSFTVASKASLLTVERTGEGWTVSVHKVPAYFLIVSHGVMLACTVLIVIWLYRHPSGLMWDPAALADQVAMFTQCGTLDLAAAFELPTASPKDMSGSYRLGYWAKGPRDNSAGQVVIYGVAALPTYARGYNGSDSRDRRRSDASAEVGGSPPALAAQSHICECYSRKTCDHYPYQYMPFISSFEMVLYPILVFASLILLVISICRGHYNGAFWVTNSFHSNSGSGNSTSINGTSIIANTTLTSTDHLFDNFNKLSGRGGEVWLYAFLYRSIPTYFASAFATGFLFAMDINHRFVQPFLAMRQPNGGTPDETILCTYNTDSSLELPGKAIVAGHYKVAYHSILFGISPLFPIYVASLYTIANTGERIYFTYSPFSLNMVLIYLIVYAITLLMPWPSAHRLMPRVNYNLIETVAMCHASSFAASANMLDNNIPNATQSYMYDRIRLREKNIQDRYVYGQYRGTDGKLHIGFDIAETAGKSTGTVEHIPVEKSIKRWFGPLRRRRMPEKSPHVAAVSRDEDNTGVEMPMWREGRGREAWYNESTSYERVAR